MSDLNGYMKNVAELTEAALNRLLPAEEAYPPSIHRLMRYSTFAGGKRIRPCLIMAAYEACGGVFGDPLPIDAGAAIDGSRCSGRWSGARSARRDGAVVRVVAKLVTLGGRSSH